MRLVIEVHGRLPLVEGDFGQLQQVLLNLLQNAQQAIEESAKGNTLGVRAYSVIPGRVRLKVWDDGPGIPESLRARIFDPFFTTKGPEKGTGLGLAIVRGIVRQQGGTVALQCPGEGGAWLLVELPAVSEFEAKKCVQERQICSVGGRPTGTNRE